MVNFCMNCGTAVKAHWNACPYCGFQISHILPSQSSVRSDDTVVSNPYYIQMNNNYDVSDVQQPSVLNTTPSPEVIKSRKRVLSKKQIKALIIVGVFIIAGVIIGVSIFFGFNQVRTINYYVNNGVTSKSYTVIIPRSTYDHYTYQSHPSHSYNDYDLVIATIESYCTPQDSDLIALADIIQSECSNANDDEEVVNALLSFSQGIGYRSELIDVCKYPLETLFNSGDCEDLCVFFASLVESLGYQAILICVEIYDYETFDWVGHVIVGVYLDFTPSQHSGTSWYYEVGGDEYWICETTDQGWMIGELPVLDEADISVMSYAIVS